MSSLADDAICDTFYLFVFLVVCCCFFCFFIFKFITLVWFLHYSFGIFFCMIIGRNRCRFSLLSFFFGFLWFLYPLFMFLGGAAERAGIFKDDFIIKVFSVRLGLIFFFHV